MKEELVSIIVPVYNSEKFIQETINTVLNQTYKNWELILIDDCSTDQSKKILDENAQKDKRIIVLKNKENSKTAITRNNGIKHAKGKYICFIDADDLWEKDKIEKQVLFMEKKKCEFSFTGYVFANQDGKPDREKSVCSRNNNI